MAIKIQNNTIIDDNRNIVNAGITSVTSLSIGDTQVISSSRQLQNIVSLDSTTIATIESTIANPPNTFTDLQVIGISTLGITSATNLTAQQLSVSGIATVNSNFIVNGNTLVADATNNRVGVGTTNPQVTLDVVGNSRVSGILTATSFVGNLTGTATTSTNVSGGIASVTSLNVGAGGTIITTNASGFVGINTTIPGSTLAVGGTITELYAGQYWNIVSQADVGYGASQVPLNQYLGRLAFLDDFSPNGLRRDGGSSDDVIINSSGFVGIGTTNPLGSLQVGTGITMYGSTGIVSAVQYFGDGSQLTGVTAIAVAAPAGTNGQVQFNNSGVTGGARFFNFDSTNFRVGIGTSTPTARLSVSNSTSGNSLLIVNDNLSDGSLFRVSNNTGNVLFDVDSDGTIIFPTSGNVGIGTTVINPTSKLQVDGDVTATNFYGNASTLINTVNITAGTGNQSQFLAFSSGIGLTNTLSVDTTELAFNPSTGNLGIGTITPTSRLSVSNPSSGESLLIVNDNLSDGSLFRVSNNTGNVLFDVDSGGTIIFPTSGNVGIGTTLASPSSKLQVDGDIRVGVNTSQGVILTSSNGTRYRLIVSDAGVLSTVLVS